MSGAPVSSRLNFRSASRLLLVRILLTLSACAGQYVSADESWTPGSTVPGNWQDYALPFLTAHCL
ncbi:MAG: hypothetical protein ACO3FE_07125, partial [Planctomycetaceae bacterium]